MGKASKWFRNIFGLKKPDPNSSTFTHTPHSKPNPKRLWTFVKSTRDTATNHRHPPPNDYAHFRQEKDNASPDDHAIAVAAAMEKAAEAAVTAAKAAAVVVRLTTSSPNKFVTNSTAHVSKDCRTKNNDCCSGREEAAAVRIQSAFRGYLARRALRALKGLVRLQAIVRGFIERKRNAEFLRGLQCIYRAQLRARSGCVLSYESSQSSAKSSQFHQPGPPTPEKFEQHSVRSNSTKYEFSPMLKKNGSNSRSNSPVVNDKAQTSRYPSDRWINERLWNNNNNNNPIPYDENHDKILEVDYGKHRFIPKQRNLFHSSHLVLSSDSKTGHQFPISPSSVEVESVTFHQDTEESPYCTASNSPQVYSACSRGGTGTYKRSPFTPTKSDGYLTGYADHPSYMAYTESSKAKARSLSAPRQRPQYERSGSTKRNYLAGDSRLSAPKVSSLHANFTSKAYPGSGRLDRLGMPVGMRY